MKKQFLTTVTIISLVVVLFFVDVKAQQTPPASTPPKAPATSSNSSGTSTSKSAGQTTAKKPPVPFQLKTDKDKLSYALGMNLGTLSKESVDIEPAVVLRGLKDSLAGKTLLTEEQEHAILTQLQNDMRKKQQEKIAELGIANKKEGETFLAENKAKEGVVTLPNGLQYKILTEGTGPKPTATDTVTCNYRGTFIDGTEFDSSSKHGQAATFPVTGVIKGWTEALQLMPVGSKWQIVVPSELAYGPSGRAPLISPNKTLIFEIELVSIKAKEQPADHSKDLLKTQPSIQTVQPAPAQAPPK